MHDDPARNIFSGVQKALLQYRPKHFSKDQQKVHSTPSWIEVPRALDIYQNWIFVFCSPGGSPTRQRYSLSVGRKMSSEERESFDIEMERVSSARTCTTIEEEYEYLGLADIVRARGNPLLGSTRFSICPRRAWRNLWRKEKGLMAVYVLQVGE